MSTAQLTFRSAVWNHAGRILEYVLMYLTSVLIARGLGVEENGRFVGLFSISQLLLVISSLGLETSLNKFIPQLDERSSEGTTRYIMRRLLGIRVLVFLVTATLFSLAAGLINTPLTNEPRQVLLVVMVFAGLRSVVPLFSMVLTARLQTHITARLNLTIRVIELGGVFLLARESLTVQSLFVLFGATSLLHTILYVVASRMHLFGEAQALPLSPILQFGGIFWGNTLVDFVLGRQGDVLFLRTLLTDPVPGGLYDVAYSIVQLATMAMTVGLAGVTFAAFARLAVKDREIMNRFYAFSIRIISLLTIPLSAFVLVHARSILGILYTTPYLAAEQLVQGILLFRIASRLFGGPENAEYLLSDGRVGIVVAAGCVAATVNVTLNILLIPLLEAKGAVIASGCGNVLVNGMTGYIVWRKSGNKMQFGFWAKLSVVSLFAAYVSGLIGGEGMLAIIMAGVLFLGMVLVLLRLIKPLEQTDSLWLEQISPRIRPILLPFVRVGT